MRDNHCLHCQACQRGAAPQRRVGRTRWPARAAPHALLRDGGRRDAVGGGGGIERAIGSHKRHVRLDDELKANENSRSIDGRTLEHAKRARY